MKGRQTLIYDETGKTTTFDALFHKPPRDIPQSRPRIEHAFKPPGQKGTIRGVSFLDTPREPEEETPESKEKKIRSKPMNLTVGEFEDLMSDIVSLKNKLFATRCIAYGTLSIVVILLIDRFL